MLHSYEGVLQKCTLRGDIAYTDRQFSKLRKYAVSYAGVWEGIRDMSVSRDTVTVLFACIELRRLREMERVCPCLSPSCHACLVITQSILPLAICLRVMANIILLLVLLRNSFHANGTLFHSSFVPWPLSRFRNACISQRMY